MKKLLMLGGDSLLLPVIETAKAMGVYTITCDYLPDNIAHKYSDEYVNFSTTDKDGILEWAIKNHINGVITFTDSGALTAAYVAENMGLPYQCSYKAASILQDKSKFRQFLIENNFNCPHAKGYTNAKEALKDIDIFSWPVIVKPVDSAGSKGVKRIDSPEDLEEAINAALLFSQKKQFIIEDFLEKDGFSCGSESFAIDGKIVYNGIYDQYFDKESTNPYVPSGEVWPSVMEAKYQEEMKSELQRLFNLLGVSTGLFNIEFRLCKNGKLYLMEVSPRAGGNRLTEMLRYATGQDLIKAEVDKSVGHVVAPLKEPTYSGHFAILVMHSLKAGLFDGITISTNPQFEVIDKQVRYNKGEKIGSFTGANALLGTLFLKFSTREILEYYMDNQFEWLTINVR